MEFKAGDRVHVTSWKGRNVDFYTTLSDASSPSLYLMVDSSKQYYEGLPIFKPDHYRFGKDKGDYYTLATDEEDTEEPVIQRINDVPDHYQADIDVIEFCRQHFTDEEFKGAMKFNLIKYPTRLGRKDDMVKELDKIIDYAQRYKEVLVNGTTR